MFVRPSVRLSICPSGQPIGPFFSLLHACETRRASDTVRAPFTRQELPPLHLADVHRRACIGHRCKGNIIEWRKSMWCARARGRCILSPPLFVSLSLSLSLSLYLSLTLSLCRLYPLSRVARTCTTIPAHLRRTHLASLLGQYCDSQMYASRSRPDHGRTTQNSKILEITKHVSLFCDIGWEFLNFESKEEEEEKRKWKLKNFVWML